MSFKLINPLEDFLNDLFKIHNEIGFPKFFYTSRANVVIVLFVAKSDLIKEEVGFEDICNVVPKSITLGLSEKILTILSADIKIINPDIIMRIKP